MSWLSAAWKWGPLIAVRANAQRAEEQIIRIRPLLKSSEVRKRRKAACIETFVKLTLIYGLATIVMTENYPQYSIPAKGWTWDAGLKEIKPSKN